MRDLLKDFVSRKIKKLHKEGYSDPKQRAAIAYSYAKKQGFQVPQSKKGK